MIGPWLVYFLAAITICNAQTTLHPHLQAWTSMKSDVETCVNTTGANPDDVNTIWAPVVSESYQANCLLACILKQAGLMDNNNKINYQKLINTSKRHGNQLAQVYEKCKSEETTESDQCAAAKTYKQCFVKYKEEFHVADHF